MDEVPMESLGPEAVEKTWERAYFYLPAEVNPLGTGVLGGRRGLASLGMALDALAKGPARPVVVYLHGCGGFGNSGKTNANMLAEAGFVVVAPDSFARPGRVKTCNGKTHSAAGPKGIYAEVIGWRLEELQRALQGLKDFPWVDGNNLFLFGHSQGSNAVAFYDGAAFKARVMTGTRCSRGYRAPTDEPALAVSSVDDPWFRGRPVKCLDYTGRTALKVLMLDGKEHVTARVPEGRRAILEFLGENLSR
tara:strand:+ start:5371 stop:6117 length:747 start_codon:yes stop_codon:yes gene_type:complete